jgi:uncharacterized protein YrrD
MRHVSRAMGENERVIVLGPTGEHIGTVDRIEIDQRGKLKSVILICSSGLRNRKRIAVDHIRSLHDNVIRVALSSRDVFSLEDVVDGQDKDGLLA